MTYRNNMVLSIFDANKNPLREFNGIVYLPHDSNYHVYLKNTADRRARAEVFIDGAEVTNGGVIVDARGNMTLSRFLNDGDLSKGASFKFVALSDSGVQDPTSGENGIIKVKFWLEKFPTLGGLVLQNLLNRPQNPMWIGGGLKRSGIDHQVRYGDNTGDFNNDHTTFTTCVGASMEDTPVASYACNTASLNGLTATKGVTRSIVSNGATAAGKEVSQNFHEVYWGGDDEGTLVELELKIIAPGKIVKPVVDYCAGCGKKRFPKKAKFCTECGDKYPIM